MRLLGWTFSGCDEAIRVAVLRLGCEYLDGSCEAGTRLFVEAVLMLG
jgi:hypothetical protein